MMMDVTDLQPKKGRVDLMAWSRVRIKGCFHYLPDQSEACDWC